MNGAEKIHATPKKKEIMKTKTEPSEQIEVVDTNEIIGTITQYTTYTEHTPVSGSAQWLAGASHYETEDGRQAEYISAQEIFIEIISGRIWRKI